MPYETRTRLAREATGLPLEVPLWMFDRMMCSSARREHHPQVVITALADLQALLAEVIVERRAKLTPVEG